MSSTPNTYQPTPQPPVPAGPVKTSGLAVTGFVLALIALLLCLIPIINNLAFGLAILGLIFAAVGLRATRQRRRGGRGLAIAGIVLAIVAGAGVLVSQQVFSSALDSVGETTVKTPTETAASDGGQEQTGEPAGDTPDSTVGTTRDNPAPLGSAISGGDWTVTINSVSQIESSSLGQKAADGFVLLLINRTATYTGSDPQGDSAWASVTFVAPSGESYDSTTGSTLFVADDSFDSLTTVYEGGSVTGNTIIEVPAEGWQNGVLAVSPGLFSDDTFVAVQ